MAICLWYVSFFVLSVSILRHVNVRKSKFVVFSMRVCLCQENSFVVHGAMFREGWFAGRRHSLTLLLKLKPEKFAVASKQNVEQWNMEENLNKLILKTIGNRKGDCAWSCSRWQTQPEKICKSQRTNQCHSLRTLYWFVLCNLQIFSGCVCHLEQLHAQSPFLFPIVFSINLIPFFDICSVDLLAVFQPGCSGMCYFTCYFTWAAARSQQLLFVVLAAGLWCLTAGCHVKSPLFPQPPLKQKCAPRSRWEKAYMRKHTYK